MADGNTLSSPFLSNIHPILWCWNDRCFRHRSMIAIYEWNQEQSWTKEYWVFFVHWAAAMIKQIYICQFYEYGLNDNSYFILFYLLLLTIIIIKLFNYNVFFNIRWLTNSQVSNGINFMQSTFTDKANFIIILDAVMSSVDIDYVFDYKYVKRSIKPFGFL